MDLIVNQAILHILDTNINTPVLSENTIDLENDVFEFLNGHILNCFKSDNVKHCLFLHDSNFKESIQLFQQDLVNCSKQLACDMFNIMIKNVDIPSGDLIVCCISIDNIPYICALKMNYKHSFIHHYMNKSGENSNSIIKQRTTLPPVSNKVDEFFFVNLSTLEIILAEKKYEIDGVKDCYISSLILECTQNQSEKVKFSTIKKIAESSLKNHYADEKAINVAVSSLLVDGVNDNILEVERLKEKVATHYPLAKDTFSQQLSESKLSQEKIYVAPASCKKLEKQSIKTKNGVVLNIPVELMNEENIEFINNPDGSVSILIKNVYM